MESIFVPERFTFAVGETFSPPPVLWQINTSGWNCETSCWNDPTCWQPVNLTDCTAIFTARQSPYSAAPSILASSENGMITINGTAGSIQLILPSWYTTGIAPFSGYWDLWVYYSYPTLAQYRLFGGEIIVYQAVGSP